MKKLRNKDYSHLEGKVVELKNFQSKRGVVIGCDYDIGITIVSTDDPNDYVLCLIGPSAPNNIEIQDWKDIYPSMFYSIVRMIKKGKINPSTYTRICYSRGRGVCKGPSAEHCAFNQ